MKANRAASRYAKAILQQTTANKSQDVVAADFKNLVNTFENSHELGQFLSNPVLPSLLKLETLEEIFKSSSADVKGLFKLLTENNRLPLLKDIAQQYLSQYDKMLGKVTATVITAVPLTQDLETKVLEKAKSLTKDTITLVNAVDPAIIGGFILRLEDLQYDASVAGELKALKRELTTNNRI